MSPMKLAGASIVAVAIAFGAPDVDAQGPPPWARTEMRDDCASFTPLRQPYFGDTHVHTELSFDGATGGIQTGPRDAYEFAKGLSIDLPGAVGSGTTRTAQLRRPLHYTAVTDHAEMLGETSICLKPGYAGYDDPTCVTFREGIPQDGPGVGTLAFFVTNYLAVPNPVRHALCGPGDADCLTEAGILWGDIQAAAEEHYDRTDACGFTTFVGYEWTRAPNAANLHHNVIFRNHVVPLLPTTGVEEPTVEGLLNDLQTNCLDGLAGCDVLAIPHNSNLSNGKLLIPFNDDGSPFTAADAAFRSRMTPLVEISQHKGDSECRPGVLTNDELCGYEKMTTALVGIPPGSGTEYDPRLFVRNALKEGIELEETLGANPFQMGIIAATDTHNSTPGLTNEEDFGPAGHLGTRDATPEFILAPPIVDPLAGIEAHAGGLGVLWAEENSRDALFAAMRRREVYGTSGTRPVVRFFAGDYRGDLCDGSDLVDVGYRRGVPMGGEIGALRRGNSPVFTVSAMKDPGGAAVTASQLQRVQIVKGWVNSTGATQERVVDVAGTPNNGAAVDPSTCAQTGVGSDSLCTVWEDPDFLPDQRAFYYVRVVENPSCRWSTYVCNAKGVDCNVPATITPGLEECCNPDIPKTIQERAWTSPIWYRPDSFGRFKSSIKIKGGGQDTLKLKAGFHRVADELDPTTQAITITLSDDDTIYSATIPPGTMFEKKPGVLWTFTDPTGAIDGIKRASLKIGGSGQGKLSLATVRLDLSNADLTDHFVHTTLEAATYRAEHVRLWEVKGTKLKPQT